MFNDSQSYLSSILEENQQTPEQTKQGKQQEQALPEMTAAINTDCSSETLKLL